MMFFNVEHVCSWINVIFICSVNQKAQQCDENSGWKRRVKYPLKKVRSVTKMVDENGHQKNQKSDMMLIQNPFYLVKKFDWELTATNYPVISKVNAHAMLPDGECSILIFALEFSNFYHSLLLKFVPGEINRESRSKYLNFEIHPLFFRRLKL